MKKSSNFTSEGKFILFGVITTIVVFVIGCICVNGTFISRSQAAEREDTEQHVETISVNNHTHNWTSTENIEENFIETIMLQSVACQGVERVYLVSYKRNFWDSEPAYYIFFGENFINHKIITNEAMVQIEYITDGQPRVEKYIDAKKYCTQCNAELMEDKYMYKFYIPEGTLLVTWN